MRPPDLPGGNQCSIYYCCCRFRSFNEAAGFTRRKRRMARRRADRAAVLASMRPPDLPGGNAERHDERRAAGPVRFNEAAGFTRRKQRRDGLGEQLPIVLQ